MNNNPSAPPLATIVIDNYNYAQFLGEAIDSALAQSYSPLEVIVVDDGSTDGSCAIIESYGSRITSVFKKNGGQGSAFNAGFAVSSGSVVCFLDADDILLPGAIETIAKLSVQSGVAKVHWPMLIVDREGRPTGDLIPSEPLPSGDLRGRVIARGPISCASPPTSGNAWPRWVLKKLLPVPETNEYYKTCADEFLYTQAPVLGLVEAVQTPLGKYRIHGGNTYTSKTFSEKLEFELFGYDQQAAILADLLRRLGLPADPSAWKAQSWFHQLDRAVQTIRDVVPDGERFVLIDDCKWDMADTFEGRSVIPYPRVWAGAGRPFASNADAIQEMSRLTADGVRLVIVAWPAFWWLDEYPELFEFLRSEGGCISENGDLIVFRLSRVCQSLADVPAADRLPLR